MGQPTRTIEWTVEQYILSRTGRHPVSTREAIRALRKIMQKCALSDRELTDLAKCAVNRHLAVDFDGNPDAVAEELWADHEPPDGLGSSVE